MKIRKLFAAVLALCCMVSMFSVASAEETLTIGVIGPMTGGAAVYGTAVANGARIAADEINALGGVQIVLDVQDDEHDPEKAVNAYSAVLDNGAQFILGTVTTGPCLSVSALAYEERIFMLTPSASATGVTEGKDNVFQVCFTDPGQGIAAADMIAAISPDAKVGIIFNNADAYSTGIKDAFVARAAELNLAVVANSSFASDNNADFSVQIAACKDAGADLIFLPIYYTPASLILAQCKAIAYAPTFFGVDGMDGILTLEGFDKTLAEGVMLLTPFAASSQDDMTQKFVKAYVEKFGEEPNQFAADGYDAAYILKAALQAAGCTPDMSAADICDAVISVMTSISYDGVTGKGMTWQSNGEVSKAPKAVVIEGGVYVGM